MRPKIEYLARQHKIALLESYQNDLSCFPPDALDYLNNISPNEKAIRLVDMLGQRQQYIYKYLPWIVRQYTHGDFMFEDLPRVYTALQQFHKCKRQIQERDIGQYKLLSDLEDAVTDVVPEESVRQKKVKLKDDGSELLCEDESGKIIKLLTPEAAIFYSAGTRWCTSNPATFLNYQRRGALCVLLGADNQKFQFQVATEQFMDAKDHSVQPEDLMECYTVFRTYMRDLCSGVEPAMGDAQTAMFLLRLDGHEKHYVFDDVMRDNLINVVLTNPEASFKYATEVVKGRWEKGEATIIKDLTCACKYATTILERQWPEINEHVDDYLNSSLPTLKDNGWGPYNPVLEYARLANNGKRWPPIEAALAADIIGNMANIIWYCRNIIGGRWYEVESVLADDMLGSYKYDKDVVQYFKTRR